MTPPLILRLTKVYRGRTTMTPPLNLRLTKVYRGRTTMTPPLNLRLPKVYNNDDSTNNSLDKKKTPYRLKYTSLYKNKSILVRYVRYAK
jgi:hypothetical protein